MYFPVVLVDSCCMVVLLRYSVLRLGLESVGPGQLHNNERSEVLLVRHDAGSYSHACARLFYSASDPTDGFVARS